MIIVKIYLFLVPFESDHVLRSDIPSDFLRLDVVGCGWIITVLASSLVDLLKIHSRWSKTKWVVLTNRLFYMILLRFFVFQLNRSFRSLNSGSLV